MRSYQAITLAIAGLICSAKAYLNQVTVWSGDGCSGNSDFAYTQVSQDYCFEGLGGNSFDDFGSTCGAGGGYVTTWSGANCEGSSAVFEFPEGCTTIPFASIELYCYPS